MGKNTKRHSYKKRKKAVKKSPFASPLEQRLFNILQFCKYEAKKVPYITKKTYNPDFTFPDKDWLLIEAKGRFKGGREEASKYRWVAKSHPDKVIVFILESPNIKCFVGSRARTDGSHLTISEWCIQNNFLYFPEDEVPQWFIDGKFTKDELIERQKEQKEMFYGEKYKEYA